MTELEEAVEEVRRQMRLRLADSTYPRYDCHYKRLLELAEKMGVDRPCQELYDEFARDDFGSRERRANLNRCIRQLDAVAGTHALRIDGVFYNEPKVPSGKEAEAYFEDAVFPVGAVDLGMLIAKARSEMAHIGLSDSTMGQFVHAWRSIWRWMLKRGIRTYDRDAMLRYIEFMRVEAEAGRAMEWKRKIGRRSACVLMEVAETGAYRWHCLHESPRCAEGIEPVRRAYLDAQSQRNVSKATLALHDYAFRKTMEHADVTTAEQLAALSRDDVRTVVRKFGKISNSDSMSTLMPIVRNVLRFLHDTGAVSEDMSGSVASPRNPGKNVAAYLTADDQAKLVEALDGMSLRDKAIMLVLLRLGLRNVDVVSMKLSDIDWNAESIAIEQSKTSRPLVLPLLPDVGNAIYDYVTLERPDSESPQIFLRSQAPHIKMNDVYHIVSAAIGAADVEAQNRRLQGPHLFRYTLVRNLLEKRVPRQVVTGALGHTSSHADKAYLTVDEAMLRACALELPPVVRKEDRDD